MSRVQKKSFHITLLFAILQCAAVYYTTLYYVLHAILYYIPPCSVLYFALLYFTTLYYSVLLYDTILFDTVLYHTVLEYTTPSYSLSYDTILQCTVLYYTIMYMELLGLQWMICGISEMKSTGPPNKIQNAGNPECPGCTGN